MSVIREVLSYTVSTANWDQSRNLTKNHCLCHRLVVGHVIDKVILASPTSSYFMTGYQEIWHTLCLKLPLSAQTMFSLKQIHLEVSFWKRMRLYTTVERRLEEIHYTCSTSRYYGRVLHLYDGKEYKKRCRTSCLRIKTIGFSTVH